jgi:hypothetical protein
MKSEIKKIIPSPLMQPASKTWYWLQRTAKYPEATLHPWRRESIRQLKAMKDIHKGERCFIIGNGPSLKKMDLSPLRNEYTFGMNRIYLLFPELGFDTSYYLSVNQLVIEQCADDIRKLPIPKFLSWHSHELIAPTEDTIFLFTTYTGQKFARDATGRLWEGATVTYVAMQLAYHMGFSDVMLIGVDHNFKTKGQPNTTITSQGDDPDHFNAGYFGKGFRWQLPDLETSERAYRMAKDAFERDGRQIVDATVDGKLTVFPKVDYNALW